MDVLVVVALLLLLDVVVVIAVLRGGGGGQVKRQMVLQVADGARRRHRGHRGHRGHQDEGESHHEINTFITLSQKFLASFSAGVLQRIGESSKKAAEFFLYNFFLPRLIWRSGQRFFRGRFLFISGPFGGRRASFGGCFFTFLVRWAKRRFAEETRLEGRGEVS